MNSYKKKDFEDYLKGQFGITSAMLKEAQASGRIPLPVKQNGRLIYTQHHVTMIRTAIKRVEKFTI